MSYAAAAQRFDKLLYLHAAVRLQPHLRGSQACLVVQRPRVTQYSAITFNCDRQRQPWCLPWCCCLVMTDQQPVLSSAITAVQKTMPAAQQAMFDFPFGCKTVVNQSSTNCLANGHPHSSDHQTSNSAHVLQVTTLEVVTVEACERSCLSEVWSGTWAKVHIPWDLQVVHIGAWGCLATPCRFCSTL